MELKTKYQYTYFIYPYVIEENRYQKYLLKLLKDKKCQLKVFEKEKDLNLYSYFLPTIRSYLFPTFDYNKAKMKRFEELETEMKAAVLQKNPCTIFEYQIRNRCTRKSREGRINLFQNSKNRDYLLSNWNLFFKYKNKCRR